MPYPCKKRSCRWYREWNAEHHKEYPTLVFTPKECDRKAKAWFAEGLANVIMDFCGMCKHFEGFDNYIK